MDGPEWLHGLVLATGGDFATFRIGIDSPPSFELIPNRPVMLTTTGQMVITYATEGLIVR